MLLSLRPNRKTGLSQFVEDVAHRYLPVHKLPLSRYLSEAEVCVMFCLTPDALFFVVKNSSSIHGIVIAGQMFVHPDGLKEHLLECGKTYMRRAAHDLEEYRNGAAH